MNDPVTGSLDQQVTQTDGTTKAATTEAALLVLPDDTPSMPSDRLPMPGDTVPLPGSSQPLANETSAQIPPVTHGARDEPGAPDTSGTSGSSGTSGTSGMTGSPDTPSSTGGSAAANGSSVAATQPPKRVWLTILNLILLGTVGSAVGGAVLTAFGVGLLGILALGAGLLLLAGLVYVVFGIAWAESARTNWLYQLGLPELQLRKQDSPGFGGYLRTLGRQAVDGRMWRALASFVIGTFLGTIVVGLLRLMGIAIFTVGASIFAGKGTGFVEWITDADSDDLYWFMQGAWPVIFAVFGLIVAAAGIYGLALLHRTTSIAIVGSGIKEAELTERAETFDQQRAGAVRAADVERTRIERDLHDGLQPRLVSVGMTLGLAQQKIESDPQLAKQLVGEAHASTKTAITELRQLARGIYASVLEDRGLDAALSGIAARSHIPVQLDVRLQDRCSRDAEAAVYFALAESLTNAAKHSRATESRVSVRQREGQLWARVEDNGIGGATVIAGGGLDGISNRVTAAGGTMRIDSPVGGPTALEVSVPCAS